MRIINKNLRNAKSDGKDHLTITETNEDNTTDTENSSIDESDQPYYLMLEKPELRPISPDPNNQLSQEIFKEHNKLAKKYLKLNEQIYYANDEKEKILAAMNTDQRIRKCEILKKIADKDELFDFYTKLEEELAELNNTVQTRHSNN